MKQTINKGQFMSAFSAVRPDNFSYKGLEALFDWCEDLEDDTGEEIELDVIGFCCDFSEFDSLKDFQEQYGGKDDGYETMEDIYRETQVIEFGSGQFIIHQF